MDLKSMLNDSAAQRPPRLQTSQSAYDARAADHYIAHEAYLKRPEQHQPSHQLVDSRTQSAGGYFGFQSPRQTNLNSASSHASTPSAGPHSAYARSPGAHPQPYTPRDSTGPQNAYSNSFVPPSPSAAIHQSPTPGSVNQYQNHTPLSVHSQSVQGPSFAHSQSPRGTVPPSTQVHPPTRQISPHAQYHQQPVTPLGPPIAYTKISPSGQRPTSQGYEQHYRRASHGSVGSMHGREHIYGMQQPPEVVRADSVQRQQSVPDLRERDRSVSVSPKTIPKPSPYRQSSSTSLSESHRASIHSPAELKQISVPPSISEVKQEDIYSTLTPKASFTSTDQPNFSRGPSTIASPTPQEQMPMSTSSPIAPQKKSPAVMSQSSLKRSASHMSDQHSVTEQPRKRLRRDEIPRFAQWARRKTPKFGDGTRKINMVQAAPVQNQRTVHASSGAKEESIPYQPPPRQSISQAVNGDDATVVPVMEVNLDDHKWEPTIANEAPREDLSFAVANWIYTTIGTQPPPSGGAMFEIEAKIGEIYDIEEGMRLRLPVTTETAFNKDSWRRTKFESSMNMEQHKLLNDYLNKLTEIACKNPGRETVAFEHLREYDDFYELSEEGIKHLHPSIKGWLKPRQAPRVRKTTDKATGKVKAMIIKSRISDLEVYNPGYDFDYRISISIESPWDGDHSWLRPMKQGEGQTRLKDRMSYRHLTNQIDLTQVTHEDPNQREHELEVEMSMTQLYTELAKLRKNNNSRFEDLVRSLLDNTRLLCREGSLKRG